MEFGTRCARIGARSYRSALIPGPSVRLWSSSRARQHEKEAHHRPDIVRKDFGIKTLDLSNKEHHAKIHPPAGGQASKNEASAAGNRTPFSDEPLWMLRSAESEQAPGNDTFSNLLEKMSDNTFEEESSAAHSGAISSDALPSFPSSKKNDVTTLPNGLKVDTMFLRDCCTCGSCVNPSSKQKDFATVDIPDHISAKSIEAVGENEFLISWENDVPYSPSDHVTRIHMDQLNDLAKHYGETYTGRSRNVHYWNKEVMDNNLKVIDFNDYMNQDQALLSTLEALENFGLVFLQNVPESEQSVIDIVHRIGPLKTTFYGPTWDVRSVPNAINVAYTHQHLGFHMDLLYMHQPPRIQFLHCLRSSAKGGASLFSDAYRAAHLMVRQDYEAFTNLCRTKTSFHYRNNGHHYQQHRPIVELTPTSISHTAKQRTELGATFEAVNWSPQFQGPFQQQARPSEKRRPSHIRAWNRGAKLFRDLVEKEDAVFERQMTPGECVIFDNRRVLHARTAFEPGDAGKERWLKGAYLDWDPYMSKLRVLQEEEEARRKGRKEGEAS